MTEALIGITAVLGLAFVGMPLGLAMLLVGTAGFMSLRGLEPALALVAQQAIDSSANYGLSVLPMFILMGVFIYKADLSTDLYEAARAWLGHFKGGLAHATVGACAVFGLISGSSLATAATMSKVALVPMRRMGYADSLSTGCVASAGVLGMLIPPSVPLIIYGLLTEQDIRRLFIAVTGPGLLVASLFFGVVWLMVTLRPELGSVQQKPPLRERLQALHSSWPIVLLFALVMGGLYGGVFTITESAGIGATGALGFLMLRGRLNASLLRECLIEAGKTTAMIFMVLIGAMVFGNFIALTGLANTLADAILAAHWSPTHVLLALMGIYLVLGCVMETMGLMVLTVPVFAPMVDALGINLLWFGVFVVMMIEIGMLTPPVGMNVFTVRTVNPDVPLRTIFRGTAPFVASNLLAVCLIMVFPDIVTAPLRWF